jgi:hypothetical protein
MAQDLNKRLGVRRSQVSSVLDEDEQLLAENGAFILLTNERFIQLSALGKVKKSLPLQEVERLSTTRQPLAKAGPLIAHTLSGSKVNLGNLADADWKNFQEVFAVARLSPVRAKKKPVEKDKPKEKNAQPQAPKVNPKRMEELEQVKKYGSVTAEGIFSIHKVTIYSMGYVKVGGIFGGGSIEKLLDIFGESDITKKTGLGRTATAILTGGINLALLPNQRGNVYLSVSTPSKTHSLMKELPTEHDLRLMNKLVSAGKAAISRRDTGASEVKAPAGKSAAVGVDQSLENLVKLHKDGLLDDAEYKAAKAKLLGL